MCPLLTLAVYFGGMFSLINLTQMNPVLHCAKTTDPKLLSWRSFQQGRRKGNPSFKAANFALLLHRPLLIGRCISCSLSYFLSVSAEGLLHPPLASCSWNSCRMSTLSGTAQSHLPATLLYVLKAVTQRGKHQILLVTQQGQLNTG